MAHIYRTEKFNESLTRFASQKGLVKNFIDRIIKADDPVKNGIIDRFSATVCRGKVGVYRIIFEVKDVTALGQTRPVYVARDILAHGDRDYKRVYSPSAAQWVQRHPLSDEEFSSIRDWLENIIRKENAAKQLPHLSDDLIKWLHNDDFSILNTIYEMYEWTESIQSEDVQNYKETILNGIFALQDSGSQFEKIQLINVREGIELAEFHNDIYILYQTVGDVLVLYNLYRGMPSPEKVVETANNYRYDEIASVTLEILKQDAKRAYPAYILADSDLWFKIQQDSVGNLALSPEQETLIRNVQYPIFINGQAGSGKSTMLFYLFAHLFYTHKDNPVKPLFLTYNQRLLDTARFSVKAILKKHPNFSENPVPDEMTDSLFAPFQEYILNKILEKEAREYFSPDKYISFNKFRRFYSENEGNFRCRLQNKNKFSSELVWHVIRTYIKGSASSDFTVDDYNALPKKDKSVSNEIFNEIFDSVWKKWYKHLYDDNRLWDDQDLIRYTLQHTTEYPQSAVVFCDESQDFTKNEIELLLKLSSFTYYDLTGYNNLPLAFAGDPYQTINPTGFRWESLKTIFADKFADLFSHGGIDIAFKPLMQNYRSKPAIIKFANLIQGFRFKYLSISDLTPQEPYQRQHGYDPCLFIVGDNISIDNLRDVAVLSTIFIVPSDADVQSEKEFVRTDADLNQLIKVPEEEDKPIANVLSASSSKGLEYEKVIVYKYGSKRPVSFAKAIKSEELTDSESIELSHFFNKLYVAVSRAKEHLFIIDDQDGYENFWKFFENVVFLQDEFDRNKEWHTKNVIPLVKGRKQDIQFIKENNPLRIAKEFESNGLSQRDAILLKRASQYYLGCNKHDDALRCDAWSDFYGEKWEEAGDKFRRYKDFDNALKSYWKGMNWQKIIDISENDTLKKRLSQYMIGEKLVLSFAEDSEFFDNIDIFDSVWKDIIKKIRDDIENGEGEKMLKAKFAKKIATKGNKEFFDLAAELFFAENIFEEAIDCWDRNNNKEHTNYYKSKLTVADEVNDKLNWLDKLHNYDEILKYSNNKSLNKHSQNIINNAILAPQQFDKVLSEIKNGVSEKIVPLINVIDDSGHDKTPFYISIIKAIALADDMRFNDDDDTQTKDKILSILNSVRGGGKWLQDGWEENNFTIQDWAKARINIKHRIFELQYVFNYIIENKPEYADWAKPLWIENQKWQINRLKRKNEDKGLEIKELDTNIDTNSKEMNIIDKEIHNLYKEKEQLELQIPHYNRSLPHFTDEIKKMAKEEELKKLRMEIVLIEQNIKEKWEEISDYKANIKDCRLKKVQIEKEIKDNNRKQEEISKKINIKKEHWENPLEGDKPNEPLEIPYFSYQNVKIYGLNDNQPEIDEKRGRITYIINDYEIRINVKTAIIAIENLKNNKTDDIDVKKREFNSKRNTTSNSYELCFSENQEQVTFEVDGNKIKVIF